MQGVCSQYAPSIAPRHEPLAYPEQPYVPPVYYAPIANQGVLPQQPPLDQQLKLPDINLTLMVDPHGDLHAVNKETNGHFWTAKTGRPAFKLCKDEDQVLNSYFEFDRSQDHHDDLYYTVNENSVKVDNLSVESLRNVVNTHYGPQDLDIKGDTENIWIHLRSGELKHSPTDSKDYVMMVRKDFNICNQSENWELKFSFFEVADGVRDINNIKVVHCRDWEEYFTFMKKFGIPLEILTVFYDRRRQWEDGRVTFRGRFNRPKLLMCDDAFMDITAEVVLPGEAEKVNAYSQYYLFLGSHTNLLRFYGHHKGVEEDTYLVFESYDHSMKTPGKEDPNKHKIIR